MTLNNGSIIVVDMLPLHMLQTHYVVLSVIRFIKLYCSVGPQGNAGPGQYRGGPQGYPQPNPQQPYSASQYPGQAQVSSQVIF